MKPYQQVIAATIPTLAALTMLSPHGVVITFLIFGNAHVLLAYLYQYRAGKIDAAYHKRFLFSVFGIGVFLLLTDFSLPLLTFVTAIVFMAHAMFDEIYLLRIPKNLLLICAALPVSLLYVVPLSDKLLGTALSGYAFIASIICAAVYVVGTLWKRSLIYGGIWMVVLGMILLVAVMFYDLSAEKLLGSIILFHYARWLVFYGDKYWRTPRFLPYVRDVVWMHGLIAALFLWYTFYAGLGHTVLAVFFTETGFYIVTLLHVFSTSRASDYQIAVSIPYLFRHRD